MPRAVKRLPEHQRDISNELERSESAMNEAGTDDEQLARVGAEVRRSGSELSVHVDRRARPIPFRHLILDVGGLTLVDAAAVKFLQMLVLDYDKVNVKVMLAGPSGDTSASRLLIYIFIPDLVTGFFLSFFYIIDLL
jgi:hypothetical protein